MFKSVKTLLIALLLMMAMVACDSSVSVPEVEDVADVVEDTADAVEDVADEAAETIEDVVEDAGDAVDAVVDGGGDESPMADTLNVNIALGNNKRTVTYQQATPLELPDGSVISQGMLKPTWAYIQDELGFEINDVTLQDQKATEMIDVSAATGFENATVYGGNSIAEELMSYGAEGLFIRLNDNLDMMPNFAAYLEENPNIQAAITAYDGGIYHVPYAAEIGNYARVFNAREAWVTSLLDSDDAIEDEDHTLEPAYEAFWTDRHDTNVITWQNEVAEASGALTADIARSILLTYIAETYPDLEKPSDLYLNDTAQYDIDELVALWRVVELSPNTLSQVSTGAVVDGAEISPFFVRKTSYREDALRLIAYFGGQRVHGSDSYAARFYLDEEGELQYSYAEESFLEGVDKIADMYSEGLIHSEFADLSTKDDFRKPHYTKDSEEGHFQFGFMTFDWIASTTASNEDVVGMLPPLTTVGQSDEMIHYVENTRVIKPDGWSISAASSQEEINSALTLFDYFFSEEGNVVQNYGAPENLEEGGVFTAPDGTNYPKFSQWLIDTSCDLKDCDISGFLRDFMGSHIPIGYQKEIGFELQYTQNNGPDAWALYMNEEVETTSYDSEDPLFRLVPPVFSLTAQDTAKLGQLAIDDSQRDALFLYITGADTAVDDVSALRTLYEDAGIEDYVDVYRTAYERMTE